MKNFMNAIEDEMNVSITENGAIGYKTTKHSLLDMNFKVASYRKKTDFEILADWHLAYSEDPVMAIKWLFYARDVRGGLGERRLFRVIFNDLATNNSTVAKKLLKLIAEYGRYDDLVVLYDVPAVKKDVVKIIYETLSSDVDKMNSDKSITLLAKWLPSINTSNNEVVARANKLAKDLELTPRQYRKTLSALRKYLAVVETKMSAKEWAEINYEAVPSNANVKYNNAFLRNDEERRRAYLGALEKGEAKINSSVLYPHDIVNKYMACGGWYSSVKSTKDAALEAMWKGLPNLCTENTIVVADGSGSMTSKVSGNISALDVANALAIYMAEHCTGEFHNKYITFSSRPQFVKLPGTSLRDNLMEACRHNECSNTNIEATFDLILQTAVNNKMSQEDLPKNVLIISDMEFDSASRCGYYGKPNASLFATIERKFKNAGYKMPRLIFWNVNSRTCTIPVKENELGVALVSGFSVNIVKMVMGNSLDPYELLCEILNGERYVPVAEALKE